MSNEMCAFPSALEPQPPSYSDAFLLLSGDNPLTLETLIQKTFGLVVTIGYLMQLVQKLSLKEVARRNRLRKMAEENSSITEELILRESPKDRAIKALGGKIAALKKVFTDLNEELKLKRSNKAVLLGVDKVGGTDRHFVESGQVPAA